MGRFYKPMGQCVGGVDSEDFVFFLHGGQNPLARAQRERERVFHGKNLAAVLGGPDSGMSKAFAFEMICRFSSFRGVEVSG